MPNKQTLLNKRASKNLEHKRIMLEPEIKRRTKIFFFE
jgi:hypothetical protein